MSNAAKNCAF